MYVAVISFFIWGFFNFFLILFQENIVLINVILVQFISAFLIMLGYRLISNNYKKLDKKEKTINASAGAIQALVYLSLFFLLFKFPNDAILIALFYNLFNILLVYFDSFFFKVKNNIIEYMLLVIICLIALYLIFETQLALGKNLDNLSFNSLLGFIPAFFAALIGVIYKYSTFSYKCDSIKNLVSLNMTLLYYRSLGGLLFTLLIFISLYIFNQIELDISTLEVKLGILYAIFPFLLGHFFYSISLYKKLSMIIISALMNISPVITILCIYSFSGVHYEFNNYLFILIGFIFILSSVLTVYHKKRVSK